MTDGADVDTDDDPTPIITGVVYQTHILVICIVYGLEQLRDRDRDIDRDGGRLGTKSAKYSRMFCECKQLMCICVCIYVYVYVCVYDYIYFIVCE